MIPSTLTHCSPPHLVTPLPLRRIVKPISCEVKLKKLRGKLVCRAGAEVLSHDAPFAIAIGACMLNSLLFPYVPVSDEDDDEDDVVMGPTDARFVVMSIISFIPYFNWLSWVFALMDTGKRRYALYAAVYLAPYLRTNLSLSPEESWLPIASIVLCVVHVQLEASIRNGDLDAFTFLNEAAKLFGLVERSKDNQYRRPGKVRRGRRLNKMNQPSENMQSQDEIGKWRVPKEHSQDLERVDEDSDLDNGTHH